MSDLDIIAQLEQLIGEELNKIHSFTGVICIGGGFSFVGYQLNTQGQISELGLNHCKLKEFPREICKLQQLEKLYLNGNQLSYLPKEIGKLQRLKVLELGFNRLSHLSKEFFQLRQLEQLHLGSNKLSHLPKEICKLQQLRILFLENNQLPQLSKEIGQLRQLQMLNLRDNQLTELPKEIGQLQQLQTLDLSSNQLTGLPREICQLQQLQWLYLRNNKLTQFPKELLKLDLEVKWDKEWFESGIHVEDNPFQIPPVEIVKQGRQAIIDYYDKLDFQQENSLKEELTESEVLEFLRKLIGTQEIPDEKTFWQQFKGSIELKILFAIGSIDIKKLVGTMFQKKHKYQ